MTVLAGYVRDLFAVRRGSRKQDRIVRRCRQCGVCAAIGMHAPERELLAVIDPGTVARVRRPRVERTRAGTIDGDHGRSVPYEQTPTGAALPIARRLVEHDA